MFCSWKIPSSNNNPSKIIICNLCIYSVALEYARNRPIFPVVVCYYLVGVTHPQNHHHSTLRVTGKLAQSSIKCTVQVTSFYVVIVAKEEAAASESKERRNNLKKNSRVQIIGYSWHFNWGQQQPGESVCAPKTMHLYTDRVARIQIIIVCISKSHHHRVSST